MHQSVVLLGALILSLLTSPASAQMPRVELNASFFRIDAEIASTPDNRSQGLMFRRNMAANQGMVFVFPSADRHCMWMRNTLLPLSVAFMDAQGKILNIENMQAQTETNHCAMSPARFALEMNLGWFDKKGLKPGQTIGGIEQLPAPQ